MAFQAAIGLLLLTSGILLACRNLELRAVFNSTDLGGIATGSLLSSLIIVLPALNWLPIADNGCNLYKGKLAIAFLGAANIVLLAVPALWKAITVGAAKNDDRKCTESDEGDRFFTLSLDMLCVVGFDGYFKRINPATTKILGYSKTELLAKPFMELVHPDDREATLKKAASIAAGNCTIWFENRYCCKDGSYKWIAWTANPFSEDELIYAVGRDITDRKPIEFSLLESVLESTTDLIFVKDTQGRYVSLNSKTAAFFGKSKAEFIGKKDTDIFPPEIVAKLVEIDNRVIQSGMEETVEEVVVDIEGNLQTYLGNKSPWRDKEGNIIGVVGVTRDISDRKFAEEQLRQKEEFLRSIYDSVDYIIFVVDVGADGEFRYVGLNPAAELMGGISSEEVFGKTPQELFGISTATFFREKFIECLQKESSISYEAMATFEDKEVCLMNTLTPLRDESGKIYRIVGSCTEITERKIAEQALAAQLKMSVFTADVGMTLTENQTLPVTLRKCCDAVVRHLDAAFARIWTLNVDENTLELQASAGIYTHINGAHSRIAVGEFKIGLIAKERKPHLTNAVLEDPRVSDKEWAKREGMVAFAGYPLIVDDLLIGVIAMFARQELNESTLIALGSIADSIALGIKRKQAEIALVTQQQTLRSIIDNAPIWVWMTNPNGRMLLVNKTFCEDVAIRESRFLAANHYSEVLGVETSANCMASDVKAWSQDTPSYAEEALQLVDGKEHYLETIKTQVKDGLGNAIGLVGLGLDVTQEREAKRKLQESETRFRKLAEQEALLNQLASKIRASLDLDTILATTVHQICELLQLDRCLFAWYHFEAEQPVWNVIYEAKNADLPSLLGIYPVELTGSHAAQLANLEIIRIDDFDTVTDAVVRDFFIPLGFNSLLDIPIQTPSTQLGVIVCGACGAPRQWTDEEVELLMAIGNQLAIALNQSELYEKSRLAAAEAKAAAMQQGLLNQLASQIRASLDLDTILATTVQQIRELLQVDRCLFIWYLPDALPPAWEVVHEAKNDDLLSLLGYYPANKMGRLPQKIANLEVYQVDNVETLSDAVEREVFLKFGYKSVLDLPIKSAGGLTGVVSCISCSEVRRWTKDEVELIEAIGDQLAIAISQSELYTQSVDSARIAQEQTKQLEVALCELQQTQTQLIQAEKMSSLGQMVAGIAHEINNPVSFIFGNLTYTEEYTASIMKLLQLYREEFPEPPEAIRDEIDSLDLDFLLDDLPKMLSSMQVGATRIRDIVRSLRNFSRLDESEMKKVNIHEGIDSTLMILEHRLKAQADRPAIQVVKEYGQLPLVECYAGQLNQVFMNIIANAIDVLEERVQSPGIIRIRTGVEDNFATIAIADNGDGIIDRVKQRIFDPFFTTKPIGSGTGMGLAIAHSIIVEKHKGDIKCISAVGKGTEFTIKIPIQTPTNLYIF